MKKPPLISVVMPVYNGLSLIDEQLQALSAQDYDGPWEVVISDNGSTDGLQQHIATHPLRQAGLDLVYVDSTGVASASHARNVGVKVARGDLLAFVDHDDRVRPDWLTMLARAAEESDAVSGSVVTTEINSPEIVPSRRLPLPEEGWTLPSGHPSFSGCNVAVWRYVHDAIGGWDAMIHTGEDHDYAWRLQQAGFSLRHSSEAVIDYRLRTDYRGIWRQGYSYGEGDVALRVKHRESKEFPTFLNPLLFPLTVIGFVLRSPLFPKVLTRTHTGWWVYALGYEAGRIRGSIRHRVFCF
ncbi:glycosyltransferase [Speluncibacter jeojiensis]|uniref:Glycosyltransferase n=1 Tax=Speluncibacter jeojiensis TaxID=2710754 RepID=A0A9X4RHZ4_9ACTN|nr:glycosyltransferase [Corynebacteriales bacterium D3-21]